MRGAALAVMATLVLVLGIGHVFSLTQRGRKGLFLISAALSALLLVAGVILNLFFSWPIVAVILPGVALLVVGIAAAVRGEMARRRGLRPPAGRS